MTGQITRKVYTFEGRLELLTPLHVGTGDFVERTAVHSKTRANERPQVAAIVRDCRERAYLPATTMKGLFRRAIEADEASVDPLKGDALDLLGAIGEAFGSGGVRGALMARGATLVGDGPAVAALPYRGQDSDAELGPGVFVTARTRLNGESGTAADSTLFYQEMVAAGTSFDFTALIEVRSTDAGKAERLAKRFATALRRLALPEGMTIGKGQADGFGRVRLVPNRVKVTLRSLRPDGTFPAQDATALWTKTEAPKKARPGRTVEWRLVCDGPFLVMDASRKSDYQPRNTGAPKEQKIQIRAQRASERLPLLLGPSLAGALAARATWVQGLNALRAGGEPARRHDGEVRSVAEIDGLGPVERLFGMTGFRGLLSIETLEVDEASLKPLTSVKLDRFSGAPVDNALFTTEAFVGVKLRVRLRLAGRGKIALKPEDEALLNALDEDIRRNGLVLGHGGNKGFGWFRIEEVTHGTR